MRSRRTTIEIIADMLRLGAKEVGKTQMMYGVNMSHSQMERYVEFLVTRELLERRANGRNLRYRTTLKGRHLLDSIERMSEVLEGQIAADPAHRMFSHQREEETEPQRNPDQFSAAGGRVAGESLTLWEELVGSRSRVR